MYKTYWNENRQMRVHEYCRVNPSTPPLLVIKKDTKNVRWSNLIFAITSSSSLKLFFFTKNVSMGISVRFFVKGVQITSTLITKYHTRLYLPLFFIQFYFLVRSLASYRGYCVHLLFLFFPLISTLFCYPIYMAMFKANRSKRTDNVRDFSSVRLHQTALHKRPH